MKVSFKLDLNIL